MRRSLRPSAQITPNLPSSPKCFGFLFTALKFNKVSSLKVFFNQRLSKLGHSDQKSLLNVTFNFNGIPCRGFAYVYISVEGLGIFHMILYAYIIVACLATFQ